jgi:hypothetical protein
MTEKQQAKLAPWLQILRGIEEQQVAVYRAFGEDRLCTSFIPTPDVTFLPASRHSLTRPKIPMGDFASKVKW